jgi:Tol biopolymer transport system component
VIDANGGPSHAVTQGNFNDIVPSWSLDDRWIFFGSNRSGVWQIWKVESDGSGEPQQVTSSGGMVGVESNDGQSLFLTHYGEPGLWESALSGGEERKIFDGPPTGNLNYWTLSGNNIYVLSDQGGHFTVQRINIKTYKSETVYTLKHEPTPFAGISVTPDQKRIIFAELDQASSGLTLVEHFD